MIREHRSREKLKNYYHQFIETGEINQNVHPWVADAWKRSSEMAVDQHHLNLSRKLTPPELIQLQSKHAVAIEYLRKMAHPLRDFFKEYRLSLLLLNNDYWVLKSLAPSFRQMLNKDIEGVRLGIEEIGSSSICIAGEQKVPFWMYGPEMWADECHGGDACSTPVEVSGDSRYIISISSQESACLPKDAIIAMLMTLKNAMEDHFAVEDVVKVRDEIINAAPFAVYHVQPDGEVLYANKLGDSRLANIGARTCTNLNDVILNYHHTPICKGFRGVPTYNKEVTWITRDKTYEDITTVVPMDTRDNQNDSSVVIVSMPIEDLRTLVAHAAGYTSKYSLSSMVTANAMSSFNKVRLKAARVARNKRHVLIQGEPGTGKQRMAHGIHQASNRAGGPLIVLRCGDTNQEAFEQELFGVSFGPDDTHQGRLELASGGTLFLDEIEKMPRQTAHALAEALKTGRVRRIGEDMEREINVRVIAGCDSDLKRLADRDLFDKDLYEVVSHNTIRVPNLRNRRGDILSIARHIITELSEQHHIPLKTLSPETKQVLKDYDWPGNIKQLQGVIEYAFFNTEGDEIGPESISFMGDVKPDTNWKDNKEVFIKFWKVSGGNVSRMANLLRVSRVTLYRYLRKFDMENK